MDEMYIDDARKFYAELAKGLPVPSPLLRLHGDPLVAECNIHRNADTGEEEIDRRLMAALRGMARADGMRLDQSDDKRQYWLADLDKEGFDEGERWAREMANPLQRKRLSTTMRQFHDDWTEIVACNPDRSYAQQLAFVIIGEFKSEPDPKAREPDRADAAKFWADLGVGHIEEFPHQEWVHGFVDGAVQVCRQEWNF